VDLTGRGRLAGNVAWSWGGHLVFVVAGFVMPRFIDRHVGQEALGVWDFGWSFVSYFTMASIGIGSSVNRYVAKHRAAGDVEGLNRTVASVMCINLFVGAAVVLLTAASIWAVPAFFSSRLGPRTNEATWVIGLLGASLAVQMAFDGLRGVMTGCHRWDLHNALNAGIYAATVAGMILALSIGGGLRSLGLAHLAFAGAGEVVRWALAHRVCPELRIRFADARWEQGKRMLSFGAKSSLSAASRLILVQANALLVGSYFGPAALAVYARPSALVRHAETFVAKFAMVLTPTASSLQGAGRFKELRELLLDSARLGTSLALPIVLVLAVLGDPILRIWMGERYEVGIVLPILALGYLLALGQHPVNTILMGLNLHGRVAVVNLVLAVFGIGMAVVMVTALGWGLPGAALGVALPITLGSGMFVPYYGCRKFEIPPGEYMRRVFVRPLACAAPFTVCLVASRALFAERPVVAVLAGCATGAAVLAPLYWRYILPVGVRQRIAGLASRLLVRAGRRPA
jgi:O-antigen/teichoic acid export membrane protein